MRSITTLVVDSWSLFKVNWSLLILIQLIVTLILLAVTFLLGLANLVPPQEFFEKPSLNFSYIAELLGFILINSLVVLWGTAATISIATKGEKIASFNEARVGGFKFFWPLFTSGLLFLLIVLVGLVLLIVPGLILAVWFSLYPFIVVIEGKNYLPALKRSRQLVKGNFWRVFNRWTFGFTVLVIIDLFARLVPPVGLVVSFFTGPFFLIYGYLIYQDLKKLKPADK